MLLALAVHSQLAALPIALAFAVGSVAVCAWGRPRTALAELAILGGCLVGVTGGLAVTAWLLWGHANIVTPTWRALQFLHRPAVIKVWHSSNLRVLLYDTYLLVPPAALLGWAAARLPRVREVPRAELAVVVAGTLALAAAGYLQVFGSSATLEYHFYSSMLWAGTCLTAAFLLTALAGPLLRRRRTAALPAGLVLVVPRLLTAGHPMPILGMEWTGLAVAVGIVVLGVVGLSRRAGPLPSALALAAVSGGLFLLTAARLPWHPPLPGQSEQPPGNYSAIVGYGGGQREVDLYRVASRLPTVIPTARHPGDPLLLWWVPGQWQLTNEPSAQYLWNANALPNPLPTLTAADLTRLASVRPHLLVLLGATTAAFPAGVRGLTHAGLAPRVVRRAVLRSGPWTLHVWVVRLAGFTGRR